MIRQIFRISLVCSSALQLSSFGVSQATLPPIPVPTGNPITASKALLGKTLFWDEQLSSSGATSCGTCHEPRFGMGDGRAVSLGADSVHPGPDGLFGNGDDKIGSRGPVRRNAQNVYEPDPIFALAPIVGTRRAPTTINTAFLTALFWDGRASSGTFRDPVTNQIVLSSDAVLENLIAEPPLQVAEMAHVGRTWPDVAARIQAAEPLGLSPALSADLQAWIAGRDYPMLFNDAFGTSQVTPSRIIMAIATYIRTLTSDKSKFDLALAGQATLTAQESLGRNLFVAVRCNVCHTEPLFTDGSFHNTGVRPADEDLGLGAVSGFPGDNRKFRTPSLRNVELRAPFFHNGGKQTLEEVVDFYFAGGDFPPSEIFPVPLGTLERDALVAFLKTLTDARVAGELAPFDRPALASSANAPQLIGAPTAGTGGFQPEMIAIEPPAVGNSQFTLGMQDGLGGAPVLLGLSPVASVAGIPVAGANLHFDPTVPGTVVFPFGSLSGVGPGAGFTSLRIPMPMDQALTGLDFHFQWLVVDSGLLAATEAAKITIY